jgi:hypothetical protein
MSINVNVNQIAKSFGRSLNKIANRNKIATSRTLNILSKRGLKVGLKKIADNSGYTQKTLRDGVFVGKATVMNLEVFWRITGARTNYPDVKQLGKGGVTYRAKKRRRSSIVNPPTAGATKPFAINGKAGGKAGGENTGGKLAVYRKPGFKRKVTTMRQSTIPFLFEKYQIDNDFLSEFLIENFAEEYPKQLKKAKFR